MLHLKKGAEKKPSKKELKREVQRQRTLVKEVLYPILLKYSKNIEDAKTMLAVMDLSLQTAFSKQVTDYQTELSALPISNLKMEEHMQSGKEFERDRELLKALENEKISTATSLLTGLSGAIASWQKKENLERGLETLTADFL